MAMYLGRQKVCPVVKVGGGTTINNQNKTITQNGTYTADSGYTGLGTVTVNVPSVTPSGTLSITANGSYDVTNYANASVNVASGGSNNSEDFVSFIVYSSNNLNISNSTINGIYYSGYTFTLYDPYYHILVATVPKNVSFSYSIGGNNWTNGSGTLTLSSDYVLPLIKPGGTSDKI